MEEKPSETEKRRYARQWFQLGLDHLGEIENRARSKKRFMSIIKELKITVTENLEIINQQQVENDKLQEENARLKAMI